MPSQGDHDDAAICQIDVTVTPSLHRPRAFSDRRVTRILSGVSTPWSIALPARIFCIVLACAAMLSSAVAHADLGFPDYVKLPPQIQVNPDQSLVQENLAEVAFETGADSGSTATRRGRHYRRWFTYQPASGEPPVGYYNGTEERIWKAVSGTLTTAGWRAVYVSEGHYTASMHYAQSGHDAWLRITMDAPQAQVLLEMIEIAEAANGLVHPAPGRVPTQYTDAEPIPFLAPYPGSKPLGAGHADGPLDVSMAFAGGTSAEPMLVGSSVVSRAYQGPSTLSALQFIRDNRDALVKAGWTVVYPKDRSGDSEGGILIAHYTALGRDIWARLSYEYGASLGYAVTDVGSEDWTAQLDKTCRLALNGVRFAFNQATLLPESEAALSKAAAVLSSRPQVSAEIQGHTDNVGSDDYNLRLSDARAASVMAWLTRHGIAAARLHAKGYGEAQPVADNQTDAGRARNRRVELVSATCAR